MYALEEINHSGYKKNYYLYFKIFLKCCDHNIEEKFQMEHFVFRFLKGR